MIDSATGRCMSRSAHLRHREAQVGPDRDNLGPVLTPRPLGEDEVLPRKRHGGQLVRPEPPQLGDVVGGDRLAVAVHEPRDGEHVAAGVWLDVDAEQPDRLDLEARLLQELAAQPVGGALRLVQEAAWEIPEAAPRLSAAASQEHPAVAFEDPLDPGNRIRPVLLTAVRAAQVVLHGSEAAAAARTEAPVVERTHEGNMMENHAVTKVVLLHSALGDSRLWHRQIEELRPSFDVVAPDLPGWGTTPLPTEPFSIVDGVAAELPAILIGNSFGGAVALRTALAHQDRVERLVLIGAGLPAWDWTEEMRDYFASEEDAIEAGDLDAATEVNLEFWVAPAHRDEVRPQQRLALELQTAHEEPEVIWPEMAPLSTLQTPTLVIVGEEDKADFRAIAQHLAEEIPDAELVIVPGAGHLVGIDQPEELNTLLLEFLSP